MFKNRKWTRNLIIAIVAAGLLGAVLWANCPGSQLVENSSAGFQQNVSGTPGSTIYTTFWEVGNGSANNSGTLATSSMIYSYSTGYYVFADWGDTGVVGCPGNPPPSTSHTAFLYSIANGGNAQYLIMSVAYNGTAYDFDDITNGPGNTPSPVAIPTPVVKSAVNNGDGTYTVTLSWKTADGGSGVISNLNGYYDSVPASPIITGAEVYYMNMPYSGGSTPTAPSTYATSSWSIPTSGGLVTFGGTDPGTATVTLPEPAAGTSDWFAISLLFDGASPGDAIRETSFVGAATANGVGPTAAPLFSATRANVVENSRHQVQVSWVSGTENNIVRYRVQWSRNGRNHWRAVGQVIDPKGSGQAYNVSLRLPMFGTYYLRVKAVLADGNKQFSSAMKVVHPLPKPNFHGGKRLPQQNQFPH